MNDDLTTNQKIAELLQVQTYDERMEMAKYISDAATDWAASKESIDAEYFASLLGSFAESEIPTSE